jgi:hypothetical protein
MHFALVTALLITLAGAQPPPGKSDDPFAPNGLLGQAMQRMGNVTNGPAPKGCSKYEILSGEWDAMHHYIRVNPTVEVLN